MNVREIRGMTTDDLRRKIDEIYEELFNLRFQFMMGQLEDHNRLTAPRRDVARMKTILRERELAAQMESEAA
jgi:large subunit ribosomal protein L29